LRLLSTYWQPSGKLYLLGFFSCFHARQKILDNQRQETERDPFERGGPKAIILPLQDVECLEVSVPEQIEKAATVPQLSLEWCYVLQTSDSCSHDNRIIGGMIGKAAGAIPDKKLDATAIGEQSFYAQE
jgi:hypothetical protein